MNIKRKLLLGTICALLGSQAQAGSEIATLIKMLHANGTVDDAQYGRLMAELKAGSEQAETEKKQIQAKLDKASNVEIKVDKGGIKVASSDGEFDMKIGGRVQVDSAWHDEEGTDMGNGTEIRRARIYIQGKMYNDWGYKLQYDFTGTGRRGIKDAFVTYNGFDNMQLKAGNFKDPFMLQEQTSSKYIVFTERSLMDTFSSGRHIGAMASTKHKHWTASAGLFGEAVGTSADGNDEGWGVAGRATYAPINEKTRVIHLGAAADYRTLGDTDDLRFRQQPETHISGVNIVDTGNITGVNDYIKIGGEFAIVEGPFSAQAEYAWTTVNRDTGEDLDFHGWYVQAAYFLTGESRNYKKGAFGSITPKSVVGRNGYGAWQLAARYSLIDLNDNDIDGGEAENVTIGLNWIPTPTLRFSGNYVRTLNIDGGDNDGNEPSLFQVRGQWAF